MAYTHMLLTRDLYSPSTPTRLARHVTSWISYKVPKTFGPYPTIAEWLQVNMPGWRWVCWESEQSHHPLIGD